MSVRKNNPTERAVKMSSLIGNKYSCVMDDYIYVIDGYDCLDNTFVVLYLEHKPEIKFSLPKEFFECEGAFKLREEEVVNQTETKQYYERSTGLVYDLVFQGKTVSVLKDVLDNREISVHIANLKCPLHFTPYTKEMAKQAKYNEDLSILETISETVKKNLDVGYVICHSKVEKEKDLITVSVVMGKEV